jgi:hypothetical protein
MHRLNGELQTSVRFGGNRGFLLKASFELYGRIFELLPMRDSILPLVAILLRAWSRGLQSHEHISTLPRHFE